uniref:GCM domain-containing protein n=1 Tax=Macrostomum lignano TaxID=282301 RepID=A0A1I8FHY8_9PLAT
MAELQQQVSASKRSWDINDSKLAIADRHDSFQLWPNDTAATLLPGLGRGQTAQPRLGDANTNNHNVSILKKSCLGVLVQPRLSGPHRQPAALRPPSATRRERKQCGKPCPNAKCDGTLVLQACRGHSGYPVTHFWRHLNGCVYFQAKGAHDHPAPDLKPSEEFRKNNRKATKRPRPLLLARAGQQPTVLDCTDQVDGPLPPAKALRLQAFVGPTRT